ncbi:MAG: protocatechuate 3,4-dioxygenase subunit alpha, partial [Rhodococcus sp. (in: high G+C Gram-positive bacteria)]
MSLPTDPYRPVPPLLPRAMVTRFPETPSQTGGPYVHIGLAPQQAGFDIFDNNFGNVLVT